MSPYLFFCQMLFFINKADNQKNKVKRLQFVQSIIMNRQKKQSLQQFVQSNSKKYKIMSNKQLAQIRDQLKKQILDLDHQINELQTFYIQDTREYGNLLKGFDNYIASKTARNQPLNKKQKVQNFQRLFSLSSIKSKISQVYEESYINEPAKIIMQSSQLAQKRNRGNNRAGGMNKGGGKHLMGRQDGAEEDEQNSVSGDNIYSVDESNHMKGASKRKKINKGNAKGIKKI